MLPRLKRSCQVFSLVAHFTHTGFVPNRWPGLVGSDRRGDVQGFPKTLRLTKKTSRRTSLFWVLRRGEFARNETLWGCQHDQGDSNAMVNRRASCIDTESRFVEQQGSTAEREHVSSGSIFHACLLFLILHCGCPGDGETHSSHQRATTKLNKYTTRNANQHQNPEPKT